MSRIATAIAFALLAVAGSSHAEMPQISVGALFDYMEPGKSQLLKRVRNSGEATAYVRVEITQMHYDSAGAVTETPVDAAALTRNTPGAKGLVASPARMIIPAKNGQQATRLIYRGERDSEQYYRVRYIPVVPDEGEFSLDEQQSEQYKQGVQAGVNVFTGYGTVVFVPPSNAHFDTRLQGLQVSNQGNATIVLDNLKQCLRARPDECSGGIKVHVFPGKSYTIAQDAEHYSRYELREGSATRTVDTRK